MEILKLNTVVPSKEPLVAWDPKTPPGRYLVRLVVQSTSGALSEPAQVLITIVPQ